MPTWLSVLQKLLMIALGGLTARNSTIVPLNDWQVLVPAGATALSAGLGPFWTFLKGRFLDRDSLPDTLKLVASLLAKAGVKIPQELTDTMLNVLAVRFAQDAKGLDLVKQLINRDFELVHEADGRGLGGEGQGGTP